MHQTDLVREVAEKAGLTQAQAGKAVSALLDTITATLAAGERVILIGFGTFEVRERQARSGFNPKTREPLEIAATTAPAFSAGSALKNAVRGAKKA